jgi:orotidine-5'-phosphate decarboxylase
MTKQQLYENILKKKSFLCIGLDTDIQKIPKHLLKSTDPLFEFNKQIIDATHELCVSFKMNSAFYESMGAAGWESLEKTIHYIKEKHKNIFTIADAKRGDIGNTSEMYARSFFGLMDFDAITVAPYMGEDSVKPFLNYEEKWAIVLALTSNKGADDFEKLEVRSQKSDGSTEFIPSEAEGLTMTNEKLYEKVLRVSKEWGNDDNMMYVVGATQAALLAEIRKIIPDHFLLVPGVGAQGGSLQDVAKYGMNKTCGLLVNSSRNIIYASNESNFADAAQQEAKKIQQEMEVLLGL